MRTNVELQKILADLFPLLRSIRPADLSSTLYALATALRGRGNELGETFVKLDGYLTTMNVHLPTLQQDLVLLARVSKTYAIAAPDLVRLLRNATTTAQTVTAKEAQLQTFFSDVTGLGKTSTRVLTTNEANIVRAPAVSRPLLGLLDTYSPEFPCLLKGAARYAGAAQRDLPGRKVSADDDAGGHPAPALRPADVPSYGEQGARPASATACPTRRCRSSRRSNFKNGTEPPRLRRTASGSRAARRSSGPEARNTKTTLAAIKLGIFVLVSVIVTGTLTAIMGSFAFGSETEYKAEFTSASLIQKGDDVRVAGVTVGSVKNVEIKDRDTAEVTFKIKKDVPVTTATRASIRFLNLVGDRYMALEEGQPGARAARRRRHHPGLAHHARH